MQLFEDREVDCDEIPKRYGPLEWENQFRSLRNASVEDVEFRNCTISGGGLGTSLGKPEYRATARRIRITNCSVGLSGFGTIFDDVVAERVRSGRHPIILWACAFKHVVLRGNFAQILMNKDINPFNRRLERNEAFTRANAEFYRDVDWALDISNIVTACLEIRGAIPARLIRRNIDEHFVMTREVAASGEWKRIKGYDESPFQIGVSMFLESGAEDNVFVAGRKSKYFQAEVRYYKRLRSAGLMS
jgi:hypothetical protein